jgi:hypothetical protein
VQSAILLYDKIRNKRILREAYCRVRENKEAPGIDNLTFSDIEQNGLDKFLAEVEQELNNKTYNVGQGRIVRP